MWRTALADGDSRGDEQLLRHDTRLRLLGHESSGPLETAGTAELRGLLLLGGDGDVLLVPYTGSNSLDMLWGTAPTLLGPTDVVPLLDEPLPAGVRDLAAVHASFTSFDFDLRVDRFTTTLGASTLADYEGEDPGDYDQDEDFVRAANGEFDRWIQFCTGEPFWDWVNQALPSLLFCL